MSAPTSGVLPVTLHATAQQPSAPPRTASRPREQAKGEDVHFYPLVLTPTPKIGLDLVRDKNLRPRDGKPFSEYSIYERYRHMSDAADEIAAIAEEIVGKRKRQIPASETNITELEPQFRDAEFEVWLNGQSQETALAIAVRAALRVAPLVVRVTRDRSIGEAVSESAALASAVFRSAALARVFAKYPIIRRQLRNAPPDAARYAIAAGDLGAPTVAATRAAYASAHSVRIIYAGTPSFSAHAATIEAATAAHAAEANSSRSPAASDAIWEQTRFDLGAVQTLGVDGMSDLPLWSHGQPDWARIAWASLREALPDGEDWEVWINWYEDRLRGGARGEAYELVFASVPLEVWNQGPAVANAWVRAHLPPRGAELLETEIEIKDQELLEVWLKGQSTAVALAIAVRAALRVASRLEWLLLGRNRVWPSDRRR